MLARATGLRFETLADLLAPQPWALDADDAVLGHLLTVDETVFWAAVDNDRIDALTLGDALGRAWVDVDVRTAWTQHYAGTLRALAEEAEEQLGAQRRREALRQIAKR